MKPTTPALEFICHAVVRVAAPLELGTTPVGQRRIIPIEGGSVEGPLLVGEIVPGGADWQIVRDGGITYLEARYTIRTNEGALIYVENRGYRHGPPEVLAQLMSGALVDPATYYFRTTPFFETSDLEHAWLNRTMVVASGARTREAVLIDFYAVR